mgnify:CR=1 FL=1
MSERTGGNREGSLEAPTRHPLEWRQPAFWDEEALFKELERVYDICHGCRRCFSLCNAFPVLFDHIDASPSGELDGVPRKAYWEVVDHCYLCDMCYMTKCPYVPPHPWNIDFPHLMLRAKAVRHRKGGTRFRDKVLSSTDMVGAIAGIPVIVEVVNAANRSPLARKLLGKALAEDGQGNHLLGVLGADHDSLHGVGRIAATIVRTRVRLNRAFGCSATRRWRRR